MNRTIIATVTIIAVAAVAIFGLRTYTQATTAPSPVTVHDADVNWDKHINVADLGLVASKYGQAVPAGGRPVAEQNLDGNGNIRVHEQGVVSVSMQADAGTTTTIFDGDAAISQTILTSFVDVAGCDRKMTLLVQRSVAGGFDNHFGFIPSDDGITGYGPTTGVPPSTLSGAVDGYSLWVDGNLSSMYLDLTGHNTSRFMQFSVRNGQTPTHIIAKLYCR